MKKSLILLLLPTILLSACASGPTIVSNISPQSNFGNFETYNFLQPLGTDRATGVNTPTSTFLTNAMNREMEARGLSLSDDPDLMIDFNMWAEDRVQIRSAPTHSVNRSHWRRGLHTWPQYSTTVRNYTEGSLLIDLINPRTEALVAEAAATRRISDTSFSQEQAND
ncbi:MAG: DUF4136 domain-containing protein, partial [Gammaproteobacteria bacterium]|nr:DUF4136 domain-containing protein [Gammaproteobacteria bacterium]